VVVGGGQVYGVREYVQEDAGTSAGVREAMARRGRAEEIEIIRAREQYMLGKSLRTIATETGRRADTLCKWAKAGEWEKRKDENRRKAEERQDLSVEKVMGTGLQAVMWQLGRVLKRMKTLDLIGAKDEELSREVRSLSETAAKLSGGLNSPAVQVNVATNGPTLVQINGKTPAQLTDEELAAIIAEGEEPKKIEATAETVQNDHSLPSQG
jgi:hypothetical protein